MKKLSIWLLSFGLTLFLGVGEALAQCAMCRVTVENNVSDGGDRLAAGLNTGILYLMAMPYLIFVAIGYFWYRHSRKQRAAGLRLSAIKQRLQN